jgi:hypothetical protein
MHIFEMVLSLTEQGNVFTVWPHQYEKVISTCTNHSGEAQLQILPSLSTNVSGRDGCTVSLQVALPM